MKDNLLKYILVLSLLLNFSFLGAAGYTYYQRNRYPSAPFGYGLTERGPVGSPSIHPHLFEALSLSPEQRKVFDLMRADHPDSKAIEATISEINRVQEDMQKLVVAHMLQFKSMLNEEQNRKFFDLIQGAMATRQEIQCP